MRDKILAWMQAQTMTMPGDTVICAVSGGADSVCMLYVLLSLSAQLAIKVEAAHFNHHLRGAESDRDEAFVRAFCAAHAVPLHVGDGNVSARAKQLHESTEEAARNLRYAFLESLPGKIATAHTQDDNLETVLLNLTRGTGLSGLCGIPPKRGCFIRPMLCVSRAEIEAYLSQNTLSYVTDSSNLLPDARRNRLRLSVIPLLKQENPALSETAFRMCRILAQDADELQSQAQQALAQASSEAGIRCSLLTSYPDAIRTRAIQLFLQTIRAPKLSSRHISAVDRLLFSSDPSAQVDLPGGYAAQREYDLLYLSASTPASGFTPVFIRPGQSAVLPELGLRVRSEIRENFSEFQNTLSTFAIKYDTIDMSSEIVLRPRQAHDSIRTAGGRKTIKKLMIDRKIPASKRQLLPVAADAAGVLGVYGVGINLDRAAVSGSRAVILIIEELEKEDSLYD